MAKKGKRTKKGKSIKPPVKKLEARLLGYWKKEAWEEFITLYHRQWDYAVKGQAALYWNPAVYNLLLKTVFKSQKIEIVEEIYSGMVQAPELSTENTNCLQVVQSMLDIYHGRGYPGMLDSLPAPLPDPFAKLARGLRDMLSEQTSALSMYVEGSLTRARKNEKHLALAARAGNEFEKLRRQNFYTDSVKPLTQLKKNFQDLHKYCSGNFGYNPVELNNLRLLAETMHILYSKPRSFNNPEAIKNYLIRNGFTASSHPAVLVMGRAMLTLGYHLMGRSWQEKASYVLRHYLPGSTPELPSHVEKQLEVLSTAGRNKERNLDIIPAILKYDVWTPRERMILLQSRMQQIEACLGDFLEYISDLFFSSGQAHAQKAFVEIVLEYSSNLREIASLCKKMQLSNESIISTAFEYWYMFFRDVPFLDNYKVLDEIISEFCDSPVLDSVFLGLLHKRAEVASNPDSLKALQIIQNERSPLKVSIQEMRKYIVSLPEWPAAAKVLRAWKKCLNSDDYRVLVENFLSMILDHEYTRLYGGFQDSYTEWFEWFDIPKDMMQEFLHDLGEDSPFYGLVNLSLNAAKTPPMPRNVKELQLFLQHPMPPSENLHKTLLWMLTWPSTPYKNSFIAELIQQNLDYFNRMGAWKQMVGMIQNRNMKKLAGMVWDIWEENDLFNTMASEKDFQAAYRIMEKMLPKKQPTTNKPRKKSKTKQKSMLDLMQNRQKKSE